MNCSVLVPHTVDWSPQRSPQAVHTALLRHIQGRDVVEIGARHGDDLLCYIEVARTLRVFELDNSYCTAITNRLSDPAYEADCLFNLDCSDYYRSNAFDFDVITWWAHAPHLKDSGVLAHLHTHRDKLRPGATAITLHDTKWHLDVRSLQTLRSHAMWHETVQYDERYDCCVKTKRRRDCALYAQETTRDRHNQCDRAFGTFHLLGFNLTRSR